MVVIKQITSSIPKDCKLAIYSQELRDIMQKTEWENSFHTFVDKMFADCCSFVRRELNAYREPSIKVIFIAKKDDYEEIEESSRRCSTQREKPIGDTLGFSLTSTMGNIVYLNFQPITELMFKGTPTFIFNLAILYIHEILHCYYRSSKDEQETHDLTFNFIQRFLGVNLPEGSRIKASQFYMSS